MNAVLFMSALLNIALGFIVLTTKKPREATTDEVAQMRARLRKPETGPDQGSG